MGEMMKIACLFPGYGSQFVGMAKELYDEYRIVQEYFEQANYCLDLNFVKLCFASSDIELTQMPHAYPANFLVSCSMYGLLKDQGFNPDLVVGFNQGEYAALYAAKSFSFPDGLYLLSKYASLYTQMLEGKQFAFTQCRGLSFKKINTLCKKIYRTEGDIFVAISLSDTTHIIAGTISAIDAFRKEVLTQEDITVDDQPLEMGLHSPLMNLVVDQLKMYLEKVDFKNPQVHFMNGLNGKYIQKGALIKKHILNNINMPIRWDNVINSLKDYDLIVQMGPGTQLIDLVKQQYPDKMCMAVNKKSDVQELLALITPPVASVQEPKEQEETTHDDSSRE